MAMRLIPAYFTASLLPCASLALAACHEWDPYDPRLGTSTSASASASASGSSSSSSSGSSSSGAGGADGGGVICTPSITDTFEGPTFDEQTWFGATSGGVAKIDGQQASFTVNHTDSSSVFIRSVKVAPITGCRFYIKLTEAPAPALFTAALFALDPDDGSNSISIAVTNNYVQAKIGSNVQSHSPAYDKNPVYLGISERGGTVYWETSKDAKSWSTFQEADISLSGKDMRIRIGVFTLKGLPNTGTIGPATFDNLNKVP